MAMIEISDVPTDLQRKLEARAARAGLSLSAYLLGEISEVAERPTDEELRERLRRLPPIQPSVDPVDIIREHRDRG